METREWERVDIVFVSGDAYTLIIPGADLKAMIELALFLKRNGYRPNQMQDFIPAPMNVATSMYNTGLDPHTLEPVTVARKMHDRRLQRALLQFSSRRITLQRARCCAPQRDSRGGYWAIGIMSC
jgi:radical SAM superfamily enzyme YgiQ (UPF0313 family)